MIPSFLNQNDDLMSPRYSIFFTSLHAGVPATRNEQLAARFASPLVSRRRSFRVAGTPACRLFLHLLVGFCCLIYFQSSDRLTNRTLALPVLIACYTTPASDAEKTSTNTVCRASSIRCLVVDCLSRSGRPGVLELD